MYLKYYRIHSLNSIKLILFQTKIQNLFEFITLRPFVKNAFPLMSLSDWKLSNTDIP